MPKHSQSEAEVVPQVLQAMTASGCQMFRNTRGRCKYGPVWVTYGVGPNGAGDFLGFIPIRITKAMVGHYVAVFVSAETKATHGITDQNLLAKQVAWRDRVRAAGGIAGFARSWEEGRALVTDWFKRFRK